MTMTKAATLRKHLRESRPLVSPGVYDCYSARLVETAGFKTAATTGSGLSNAVIGEPDIGLFGLRDNVDACRHHRAQHLDSPDGRRGHRLRQRGDRLSRGAVLRGSGIVGINIEDQLMPKRCGHMRGKELVEPREMAKKIEAGQKAKRDQDFVINARTDAIAVEGIEGTVARVREYVAAGADMIYPDAIRNEDDIKRVIEAAGDVPVNINMGFGIRSRPTSPLISLSRLKAMGVARVSLPRFMTAAALSGMQKAIAVLKQCMETGELVDRPDLLVGMETITGLFGYDKIAQLENEFLYEEQLETKYGSGERDYVVRQK